MVDNLYFLSRKTGLQKMFSLSGTFISNGQNFLSNMCASAKGKVLTAEVQGLPWALEAKGILMLSGAFWAYI